MLSEAKSPFGGKRILLSLLILGSTGALAVGVSRAFFSDKETSTGNTFTAGAIDLTVTHDQTANPACTIDQTPGGPIFNCTDVKPGDVGESTLHFNLASNPAWACVKVKNFVDSDNGCNEPELETETGCTTDGNGELDNELLLTVWIDNGGESASCNNVLDEGEEIVVRDAALSSFALPTGDVILPVSDSSNESMMNDPLEPGEHCLGIKWSVDPTAGNDVQTDKLGGDLEFYVEQQRNNPNFRCIPDGDKDGYAGDDCNDSDAAVHPGATEIFDAIDNDCDGLVNEGIVGWVKPNSYLDSAGTWSAEELLYNGIGSPYAGSDNIPATSWGDFLELNLPAETTSNQVRYYVPSCFGTCGLVNEIDVDVYRGGVWTDVYQGAFNTVVWEEKAFTEGSVTKARMRFYNSSGVQATRWPDEFEFYANNP